MLKSKKVIKLILSVILTTLPFLLGGLLYLIINNEYQSDSNRPKSLLSIEVDTVSSEQAIIRNQFLTSTLLQHLALVSDLEISQKESRIQARLFYAAIMAALLAFLFKKKKSYYKILIITIIIMMYLLDIHLKDLAWRQHEAILILSATKEQIQEIPSSSNIWNKINFEELRNFNQKLENQREERKIILFVNPDLEQWIFYIFPFAFIFYIYIRAKIFEKIKLE